LARTGPVGPTDFGRRVVHTRAPSTCDGGSLNLQPTLIWSTSCRRTDRSILRGQCFVRDSNAVLCRLSWPTVSTISRISCEKHADCGNGHNPLSEMSRLAQVPCG